MITVKQAQLCSAHRLQRACASKTNINIVCNSHKISRQSGSSVETHSPEVSSISKRAVFSLAAAQILLSQIPRAEARQYVDMSTAEAEAARIASSPENLIPAEATTIQTQLAPDTSLYNAADPELREAADLLSKGFKAENVIAEEAVWTRVIDTYGGLDRPWVPDVVGRAWANRGNARSRQGRLSEALTDYNQSIKICPWATDPVLNRGVVLEALGRFVEAERDYRVVLAVSPEDPSAWNNLGNATAGQDRWEEALGYYGSAVERSPEFAFATANKALAMYQLGRQDQAMREMRTLLRRYPDFMDMRAALVAALWTEGKEGEAESNWERVDDGRYKDPVWLRYDRRWPPSIRAGLEAFLELRSLSGVKLTPA